MKTNHAIIYIITYKTIYFILAIFPFGIYLPQIAIEKYIKLKIIKWAIVCFNKLQGSISNTIDEAASLKPSIADIINWLNIILTHILVPLPLML